jgi:raffinose/stachyose/melibiose transport system substrate-binding protein
MKKGLMIILMTLLTGFMVYALGGNDSGKVTIRFATQTIREGSVLDKVLAEYKKEHPNVNLEVEESPGNDLIIKINTDIQASNCPDVFTYWRPERKWDFDKYVTLGAIADLGELKDSDYYKGMFPDYAWKTGSMPNGMIVGIPRQNYYTCFLVNKTVFAKEGIELPTDWNKLVRACEQLAAKGYIVWATDTADGLDDASRLFNAAVEASLGNERGISLMTGKESWQQPDVIEALNYFLQVAKKGYAPPDSSVLDATSVITKYLNTGRAGMIIQNAGQVWNNIPFDVMNNFVALNFPLTPTTKIKGAFNELDLTNLVYASAKGFNDPAKKQAIIDLIHKITSPETAIRSAEEDQVIVPHLGIKIDPAKVHSLQTQAMNLAYAADSYKWMLSSTTSNVVDNFRLTINAVYFGEITSAQQLARRLDDNLYGKQN